MSVQPTSITAQIGQIVIILMVVMNVYVRPDTIEDLKTSVTVNNQLIM